MRMSSIFQYRSGLTTTRNCIEVLLQKSSPYYVRFAHDKPSLKNWHAAVANVSSSRIVPIGFGAKHHNANTAAFFGDRRINLAVALALRQHGTNNNLDAGEGALSVSWLSKMYSEATSNQMFASHIKDILPIHSKGFEERASLQPHDGGTFVEAAVDAVASFPGTNNELAIDELARWLVQQALESGVTNYRGILLELGGTIDIERLDDGVNDHKPTIFLATATLGKKQHTAKGASKIKAARAASAGLLDKTVLSIGKTKKPVVFENIKEDAKTLEGKFVEFDADHAMNLYNGEDKEGWWYRKAHTRKNACHRAMLAAHVFPDCINEVRVWQQRGPKNGEHFALLVICWTETTSNELAYESFFAHGSSGNSARASASLKANQFINTKILGRSTDL